MSVPPAKERAQDRPQDPPPARAGDGTEAAAAAAPRPCARPRGRPRSIACHQAILRATMELLTESSYGEVTMEGIAARAGVSKQTLYNWWPSKARLAMEAYAATAATRIPESDTGSTQEDLQRLLCFTCQVLGRGESSLGATLAGLIAAAQSDDELGCELRETLIAARRRVATRILQRGMERGEVDPELDLPLVLDLLYGPIWYRLLLRNAPLNRAFAHEIVAHLMPRLRRPQRAAPGPEPAPVIGAVSPSR
jgi:AcrR family transcriptional regulator